jgi:hypothetical protein
MEYKNFFENQKEAAMRLQQTVVLYDGSPVEIVCVADHPDGILRAYIRPTGYTPAEFDSMPKPSSSHMANAAYTSGLATYMDTFIQDNPGCGIIRKHLNSPLFNKFRPFELGMYWNPPHVYYVERQPNRRVEQGLIKPMIVATKLTPIPEKGENVSGDVDLFGPEMKRCIIGEHPSPKRCLEAIHDDRLDCKAAAFDRHFALVRGPIGTLFLAYKNNVIGQLPNGDYDKVKLGKAYTYCKEAVADLHLFNNIIS